MTFYDHSRRYLTLVGFSLSLEEYNACRDLYIDSQNALGP